MRTKSNRGFTLVELLVVVTIIGILISLMLPALQSAREMGRSADCQNHLKQMALACLAHESRHEFLPSGGWGWHWVGDPDRGIGKRQPGGWMYAILPFIDQVNLYNYGSVNDPPDAGNTKRHQRMKTPITIYHCPTRRPAVAYPYCHSPIKAARWYANLEQPMLDVIARTDYAHNAGAGSIMVNPPSPNGVNEDYASIDALSEDYWGDMSKGGCYGTYQERGANGEYLLGPIYRRSTVPTSKITDGLSTTYLCGERYTGALNYYDGLACDSDQGWNIGYDYDVTRWCTLADPRTQPMRDQADTNPGTCNVSFGSAHPAGFFMAFCDGAVKRMSYGIDRETHKRLGTMAETGNPNNAATKNLTFPVDMTKY